MKTSIRIALWCISGVAAGTTLSRETPRAATEFSTPPMTPMGITAALEHQSEGAILLDLRPNSAQNLPIPKALRDWKTVSNTQQLIVIGDANSARQIPNHARIVGIVPPWTLKRDAHILASWEISTAQLQNNARGYQIWDVRESTEWQQSRIPDSRQISMFGVENALNKKSNIALFCLTGHRSAFVVRRLRERGFQNVYSVRGGWLDWQAQKRALVSDAG